MTLIFNFNFFFDSLICIFSFVFSDVSSSHDDFCKSSYCVISSTGTVSCIPPCSHNARCDPDYKRWPFDTQNCTIHVGTWVNSGEEIDFRVQRPVVTDTELSSQNNMYRLITVTSKRNPGNFSTTFSTYPSVTFSFLIKRHSGTFVAVLVIPAFGMKLFFFYFAYLLK